jgi:hypothetical protein
MPLTSKGKRILSHMRQTYKGEGGEKKAKSVFYASINAGKIHGAEKGRAEGGPVDPSGRRGKNFPEMSGGRGGGYSGGKPVPVAKSAKGTETLEDILRSKIHPAKSAEGTETLEDIFRERSSEGRARGGRVDAHEAREKELIGELARMNRHRAEGGPIVPQSDPELMERARLLGSGNPLIAAMERTGKEQKRRLSVPESSKRAHGGPAAQGAYMVGERGPELFVPDKSGTIIPHHELTRLARKYGGGRGGRYRAEGGPVDPSGRRIGKAPIVDIPMGGAPSIRPSVIPHERWITPTNPRYEHMPDRLGPGPITPEQYGKRLPERRRGGRVSLMRRR